MQLVDQKTMFLIGFIRFFEPKTLKTFILDTFASENTVKLMFFAFLDFGGWGWLEVNNLAFCRGSGRFRKLREAGRKHFHLSWYSSEPVVTSYDQIKPTSN